LRRFLFVESVLLDQRAERKQILAEYAFPAPFYAVGKTRT
jgi:hypothetical protein